MASEFNTLENSKMAVGGSPPALCNGILKLLAAAGTAVLLVSVPVLAQDDLEAGRNEYRQSCLGCHGEGGKGDGIMAQYLTLKPANLTMISKKNNGQYPFQQIFQIIDGRAEKGGHGRGLMPIWGERYTVRSGAAGAEPYKTYSSEPFVRARILELTYYIQSLQE
jgi:mono/diheme cytochrome c family protein